VNTVAKHGRNHGFELAVCKDNLNHNIYIYKMKLAAKHGKNNGFEPVFCGNSIKINGNQPPDFQNNFKIRST